MNNLTLFSKVKSFISNHKIWSIIIVLAIVGLSFYFLKGKASTETRYVTSEVAKGNVIVSVSGSGQIAAKDTIDLKPKTSGTIIYVGAKAGDTVSRGKLLVSVDSRDAKLALENAKITLAKLVDNPDALTLLQKQNALDKLHSDGWNNTSSFIIDMGNVVSGLEDLYNNYLGYKTTMLLSNSGKDKITLSESAYYDAQKSFDAISVLYKSLSINSSKADIENLIDKSLETSKIISNAVKLSQASFDYASTYLDDQKTTDAITVKNNLASWTSSSNSYVNNINSTLNSIKEDTQALSEFLVGADKLDIQSAELTVANKQAAYDDCFFYAPFDGTISTFTAQEGDTASGSIGTLITKQKIAMIALNEVDIAKIKLNQKVTLTFDAISDLTITGKVAGIDSVGTVSSGVVTYNVTISLDVDDTRIKPGMSISATIITDTAQDVITVPSSAIKTKNGSNYVLVFDKPLAPVVVGVQGSTSSVLPTQVVVTTGLADDSNTEIISGLKEGDIIVTKTITSTTKTTTTAPSILGAVSGGGTRAGGGSNIGGSALRAATGR